jgi:AraC-like DNA-binding protein
MERFMLMQTSSGTLVWPAAMIVWGPGFTSASHRHHCVQFVMALNGILRIRGGPDGKWLTCGAALVRPDAFHEVDAGDTNVLIAFVDPEADLGSALCARIEGEILAISPIQVGSWRRQIGDPPSASRLEWWVRKELLNGQRAGKIHPNVQRAIKYLRERIGISDDLSLKALAEISGLSESRFMHVFTECIGVPVRPYILWLRLQRAACELMHGRTVTDAAHSAGFSDAAHLTRTFRRMLGITPSDFAFGKRMSHRVSVQAS